MNIRFIHNDMVAFWWSAMGEGKRGELEDASVPQLYPNIPPQPSHLGPHHRDVTIPLSLHHWSSKTILIILHQQSWLATTQSPYPKTRRRHPKPPKTDSRRSAPTSRPTHQSDDDGKEQNQICPLITQTSLGRSRLYAKVPRRQTRTIGATCGRSRQGNYGCAKESSSCLIRGASRRWAA